MNLLFAGIVEGRVNAAVEENSNKTSAFKSLNKIKNKNKFNIAESVIGHVFSYDEKLAEIVIEPELNYLERYFIPDEETESTVWGPGRLGTIVYFIITTSASYFL